MPDPSTPRHEGDAAPAAPVASRPAAPPQIQIEQTDGTFPRHWKSGSLKYDDFQPLTDGGTAHLQTCLDVNLRRRVVYKTLHPHLQDSEIEVQRFLREARVTALISHPGTVPLYELGRDREGQLYFTMKLLEGRDLRSILADLAEREPTTRADFPLPRLVDILIQAAQTLRYAHAQGVIHRDLKPANILVGGFGEVMVLDWGLAKVRGEKEPPIEAERVQGKTGISLALTHPGKRYGTPLYMSPEQARADGQIDERCDIYNLGSVLFEMLTLRNLVWGSNVEEVMTQILERPVPVPRQIAPQQRIPPALEAICLHCLQRQPADRYPNMDALITDLQHYRNRQSVSVYSDSPLRRLLRWNQRHRLMLTALIAGAFGAAICWLLMTATQP